MMQQKTSITLTGNEEKYSNGELKQTSESNAKHSASQGDQVVGAVKTETQKISEVPYATMLSGRMQNNFGKLCVHNY